MAALTDRTDERTPLLSDRPAGNDTLENGNANGHAADGQRVDDNGIPLPEEDPSSGKLLLVMGSLWVGVFLNALDGTIIATLSSEISSSFQSFTLFSWLGTAYLIANAAFQPLSGRLTDIFGRREGALVANVFFAVGTLMCGLATQQWVIILGRIIAGIGGGCLNTISTFVASDMIPLRRRGLWQGFGNLAYGFGAGVGGIFGGFINDRFGWRWAFYAQVPPIIISTILVFFVVKVPVKESDKSKVKQIDFVGSFLLVAAVALLLLGLNSGGNQVPWNHPLVYVSIPVSGILAALFIYYEAMIATSPVLPVRLLTHRTILAANFCNWFMAMGYYTLLYFVPIYFQVRGYSATAAGGRLIFTSLGTAVGSISVGQLLKVTGRYWGLNAAVQIISVTSIGLSIALLRPGVPDWTIYVDFTTGGLGYAGMLTVTLLALISAAEHKYQAVVTSSSYLFRSTGSAIGIAVSSAVFENILSHKLWERLGGEKGAAELIANIRNDLKFTRSLTGYQHDAALGSYMDALQGVWWTMFAMVALGGVISLFMKEHTLHNRIDRK